MSGSFSTATCDPVAWVSHAAVRSAAPNTGRSNQTRWARFIAMSSLLPGRVRAGSSASVETGAWTLGLFLGGVRAVAAAIPLRKEPDVTIASFAPTTAQVAFLAHVRPL